MKVGRTSDKGNIYFIGFIDHFTKYVVGFATADQTAETCAKLFVNEVLCKFGAPHELVSDQGQNFVSKLYKGICKLVGTYKKGDSRISPSGKRRN